MRPIAAAAKKFVSKIKSVRIFRFRSSTYVPFREWEEKSLSENPQAEADAGKRNSDAAIEESDECILVKDLKNSDGAEVQTDEVKKSFSLAEMGETHNGKLPVSAINHTDGGYCVNEGNETGLPDNQPPLDVTTVHECKRTSAQTQSQARCDESVNTSTPSDAFEKASEETIKKRAAFSCVSHEGALAHKGSVNATFGNPSQELLESQQVSQELQTKRSHSSNETNDTVVSDNMGKQGAHDYEKTVNEIKLRLTKDSLLRSSEVDQAQTGSNDLGESSPSMELDSKDQNDASTVSDSIATGSSADQICKTTEDFQASQNLKEKKTVDLVASDDSSKLGLKNSDPEKTERIERRREAIGKEEGSSNYESEGIRCKGSSKIQGPCREGFGTKVT